MFLPRYIRYFFLCFFICIQAFAKFHENLSDPNLSENENDSPVLILNNDHERTIEDLFKLNFPTGIKNFDKLKIPCPVTINTAGMSIIDVSCNGGNDGSIIGITASGTGTINYKWTNSGGADIGFSPNISNLSAGTYTLTVTDTDGPCSASIVVDVISPASLITIDSASPAVKILNCIGDTDASIGINITVTPPADDLVEWFKNGVKIAGADGFTFIENLGIGSYEARVTDTNSPLACAVSRTFEITEPTGFSYIKTTFTDPECFNDPGGGNLAINLGGGTAPYFYTVDGGAAIAANASPILITDLTDGLHVITVTDNLGCNPVSFNHTVNLPTEIFVNPSLVDITGITCFGAGDGSITLNGAVSGGTPNYTYTWTGPAGGTNFGASVNNLIPGTYSLIIEDLLGCSIAPVIFEVPDIDPLEIVGELVTPENLECFGYTNGNISIQIGKDPSANIEIEWFKNGTSYDNSNVDQISNLGAGIYEVIVRDVNAANDCSVTRQFEITEPPILNAVISDSQDPACFNDIQGGTITLQLSGGTLPYSYILDGAAEVLVNDNSPVVIIGLSDGPHNVLVTDSNDCNPISIDHLVTTPTPIEVVYDPQSDIIPVECGGGGQITVFASGGTGANYFYVWQGPSFGQSGFDLATITDLKNGGIYSLTVFDENNCGSELINFTVPEFPNAFTVNSVVNQMTCPTGEGNGSIHLTLGNDLTAPYFIKWEKWDLTDPDDTGCVNDCYSWQLIPDGSDSLVISDLDAGEYRTTITDSGVSNCNEVQLSFTIFENSLEILSEELDLPTCDILDAFYKFKLNNVGEVSFFLNGSPITVGGPLLELNNATNEYKLLLAAVNVPTSFLLKMTESIPDGNGGIIQGCEVLKGLAIEPYTPVTYLGTTEVTLDMCQVDTSFTIDELTVTGGTPFINSDGDPFYSYEWFGPNDFHATGANINVDVGEYTLFIRDEETCESEPITIVFSPDNEPIVVVEDIGNVTCDEENDGYIDIDISGGKEPYSIIWELEIPSSDSGSSDPTYNVIGNDLLRLNDLEEGRYRLTITSDIATCSTDNPAFQFQAIYTVASAHTIAVLGGPFLDSDLCIGNAGTLTIQVSDTSSGDISFYYNGALVGAEQVGDTNYLIFIDNPVENSILDVLNDQGCGEAIAFELGLGEPSFFVDSAGYNFNGIVGLNEEVIFNNTSTNPYDRWEWDFGDRSDLSEEDSPTHTFPASGAYEVVLRIYNELGCFKEYAEEIRVGEEYYIVFPDIFTPNSDGINDHFLGELIGIDSFEFEIYDIWNNLLFANATNSSNAVNWGWDGTLSDGSDFNGKVFKYVFKGVNTSGQEVIVSNQALLLR